MNNENLDSRPDSFQSDKLELSPYQIAGILIALGLLAWAAWQLFSSSRSSRSIDSPSSSPKLSGAEIAALLET